MPKRLTSRIASAIVLLLDRLRRWTRPSTRQSLATSSPAVCERFLRSVRAECLDHVLVSGEGHLRSRLRDRCAYFDDARPHHGIDRQVPSGPRASASAAEVVAELPVLGGLHHEYRRAASRGWSE